MDRGILIVEEGDIQLGQWFIEENLDMFTYKDSLHVSSPKKIISFFIDIVSVEIFQTEDKRTISGTGAAALVGFAVAGPVGALVGGMFGGVKKNETLALFKLKDNKMFIATMDIVTFTKFKARI